MTQSVVSVGLNGSPQPRDRLLGAAEKTLCETHYHQPSVDPRIAGTEAEGLLDVGLGLLAAPYKKLTLANQRVSAGQVSIQSQGPLEFCDALNRAVGEAEDDAHAKVGEGMFWS